MHSSLRRAVTLMGVAGVVVAGCGNEPTAARVNRSTIPVSRLEREVDALRHSQVDAAVLAQQDKSGGLKTLESGTLTRLIYLALVRQQIAARHLHVPRSALADARLEAAATAGTSSDGRPVFDGFPAWYRDELTQRSAEVAVLQVALGGTPITEEAVATYYAQQAAASFTQACASHILVPTQTAATAVVARLAAGEDFGAVARAVSTDTGSAAKGGDLGCSLSTRYVPPFAHAVQTQPLATVGAPVETKFGWHVIKVSSRSVLPLAEVRGQVLGALQARSSQLVSRLLDDQLAISHVSVAHRFGVFNSTGARRGVQPLGTAVPPSSGGSPASGDSGPQKAEPDD